MTREEDLALRYLRRSLSRRDALKIMGLGGISAAALAACGSGTAPTGAPSASAAAGSPSRSPITGSINGLDLSKFTNANIDWSQWKGAELSVGMFLSPPETIQWRDAIAAFEALSGATVKTTELPIAELGTKVFADLTSKAGAFDVMNIEFALVDTFAEPGLIEPLDAYLDNPQLTDKGWFALDDIYEGPVEAGRVKGELFDIPIVSESSILAYRNDIIDKAPDTFDEYMAAALKAKGSDHAGVVMRGQRGASVNVYIWSMFLYGFGGDFVADFPTDMHPTLNTQEAIQAVDFYAEMLKTAGPIGVANYTVEEVHLDAKSGKAAMLVEWSGVPAIIDDRKESQTAGKWSWALPPKGPAGRFPSLYNAVFAMSANSKNKEAAWGLIQAINSPPAAIHYTQSMILATRKSVAESPEYDKAARDRVVNFDEWLPISGEALSTAKPDYVPRMPHWQEIGDRVGIGLQSVISGQASAADAMNAAQSDVENVLKDAGLI